MMIKEGGSAVMTLFVGDLSIFCTEADLHELFSSFGAVPSKIQIKRGKLNEPLQYGFIVLPHQSALQAIDRLNGTKLLGRRIRIKAKGSQEPRSVADAERNHRSNWAQVHFSFITHQADLPIGEEALDRIFSSLGGVADVAIKQHTITLAPPRQTAYGFVYFYEAEAAQRAMLEMKHVSIEGIVFDCNFVNERDVDGDIRRKMLAKQQKSPSTYPSITEEAAGLHRGLSAPLPSYEQDAGGVLKGAAGYQAQPVPYPTTPQTPATIAASLQQPQQTSQWTYFSNASPPPHAPYSYHYGYPGHDAYSNHALFATGAYHLPSLSSASTDSYGSHGIHLMHSASSDYDTQHHHAVMPQQQQLQAARAQQQAQTQPGIAMMVAAPPPPALPYHQQQSIQPSLPQQPQQFIQQQQGSLEHHHHHHRSSFGIAANDYHYHQAQHRQQHGHHHHHHHHHPQHHDGHGGGGMLPPSSSSYDNAYYNHQQPLIWQQQQQQQALQRQQRGGGPGQQRRSNNNNNSTGLNHHRDAN